MDPLLIPPSPPPGSQRAAHPCCTGHAIPPNSTHPPRVTTHSSAAQAAQRVREHALQSAQDAPGMQPPVAGQRLLGAAQWRRRSRQGERGRGGGCEEAAARRGAGASGGCAATAGAVPRVRRCARGPGRGGLWARVLLAGLWKWGGRVGMLVVWNAHMAWG
eukprot:364621-Chlamydomonas_euryale.AAC.4